MPRRTRQRGDIGKKTRMLNAVMDLIARLSHVEDGLRQTKRLARWFAGQIERTGTVRHFPGHRTIERATRRRRALRGGTGVACA